MPATEKGSVCPGKNKPVFCCRKPSAETDISIPSAARKLQSGSALRLGAAGVERELRSAEAAAFPPSHRGRPRVLPAPGKPQPRLGARAPLGELAPRRAARHPPVRVAGAPQHRRARRPPPRLALYLETLVTAPDLQPDSPRRHRAPSPGGHQPPPPAFPHRAPDSVQTDFPAPLVHRGVAGCLHGVSAESDKTQPVPVHVRTQRIEEAR